MKVNSVNNNVYQTNDRSALPFRNKGLGADIINHISKNNSKMTRFLNYVGANQGEALNIIVTAVGTAIVCPLFIAFNPFSKEDKNTKVYSAWRQPISAIIAVVTQLTITKWFNDYMARHASTSDKNGKPSLSTRADLRAQPLERFLKKIVEYEHPEYDKEQVAAAIKLRQLLAEKSEIYRMRELYKDKKIDFKDLVCQEYYDKAEAQFFDEFKTINKGDIEKKFGKKLDDIWSLTLDKHLNKMLDDKAAAMGKDRQTLVRETAELLVQKEVMAEAVVKSFVRDLKERKINIDEAINNCTETSVLSYIKGKGLEGKFSKDADAKQIAQEIVKKLNIIKDYEFKNRLNDYTSVTNIGKDFDEILQNVKVKKLVRSRISDSKKVFKQMNTQLGLVVTLATLPFTCGFLNWAYPRIMEKIMPEMSAKKKEITLKIEEFNNKVDKFVDDLDFDDVTDKIKLDALKDKLKLDILKGGDD